MKYEDMRRELEAWKARAKIAEAKLAALSTADADATQRARARDFLEGYYEGVLEARYATKQGARRELAQFVRAIIEEAPFYLGELGSHAH